MPERQFYLDQVEGEEWNVTVDGTGVSIMHHIKDENGKTKSRETDKKKFGSTAELNAWLTTEIAQKLAIGFRELDAEGNYIKSPEAAKIKKIKTGKYVGKVIKALQDNQNRTKPDAYTAILEEKLPDDVHAFLETRASKHCSSLTVGDFVMRDTDQDIKMPPTGAGLFPVG